MNGVRTTQERIEITLTCGCTVFSRNTPYSRVVRYGCASGQTHGYRLDWVSWQDCTTGRTVYNSKQVKG